MPAAARPAGCTAAAPTAPAGWGSGRGDKRPGRPYAGLGSPDRTTSSRPSAMRIGTLHGPRAYPGIVVSSAMSSPSGSLPGSTASSSVGGDGRRTGPRCGPGPGGVAATDSCWPATWNSRAPNRSIGGSCAIHARGSTSGRSSIGRAAPGRRCEGRNVPAAPHRAAGIASYWARSRLASASALVTRSAAWDCVRFWSSGPRRSRTPPMTAPVAKMPAVHQNAVS
jgi:hypothetical protein